MLLGALMDNMVPVFSAQINLNWTSEGTCIPHRARFDSQSSQPVPDCWNGSMIQLVSHPVACAACSSSVRIPDTAWWSRWSHLRDLGKVGLHASLHLFICSKHELFVTVPQFGEDLFVFHEVFAVWIAESKCSIRQGGEFEGTGLHHLFRVPSGVRFLRRQAMIPNSDKIWDAFGIPDLGEEIAVILGFFLS